MPNMTPEEQKTLMKEAMTEWLDKKFAEFGKWSAKGLFAMALVGVFYLYLSSHGWKP